jgi:hypothetical protein
MANEQLIIAGIENKVKKIVELNSLLKQENLLLVQELGKRDEQLTLLAADLESKKSELVKIKLANTLEKELGVEDSKKRLEDLINEIDRCIEVLSE